MRVAWPSDGSGVAGGASPVAAAVPRSGRLERDNGPAQCGVGNEKAPLPSERGSFLRLGVALVAYGMVLFGLRVSGEAASAEATPPWDGL
jgi:hypothetical protein